MRIVNREIFTTMPAGTVYSLYRPCVFDGLYVKGERRRGDRYDETALLGNVAVDSSDKLFSTLLNAQDTGESFALDFDDVCIDDRIATQLYAVYEPDDLRGLIKALTECLAATEV